MEGSGKGESREREKEKARGKVQNPAAGFKKCWLPLCNSLRSRPGRIVPEIYFRVVHAAQNGQKGAPVAAYREQMVEIALGPKGAFDNGNIGALTRRLAADRVIRAAPLHWGNPKPSKVAKAPRVVELLRKAIQWKALLESRKVASQAEIARQEGITRARVTQVMGMLKLPPEIQERILSLPDTLNRPSVTERMLRPIRAITNSRDQVREFQQILI
jgi:hypothetical protein